MKIVLLTICFVMISQAQQTWEQVFPRLATRHDIGSIVHWNGDTVFAAGTQFTLLRSIDAGQTWENMFTHNPGFDFVRMGSDDQYLYLLPYHATTNWYYDFLKDSSQHFLIRYNVRTNDTNRITFPNPVGTSKYLLLFDLSVTPGCITILTCGRGSALVQSTDYGISWRVKILPDSMYRSTYAAHRLPTIYFKSRDTGIYITTREDVGKGFVPYITNNGGESWSLIRDITNSINDYFYSFQKRPPGEWVNDSTIVLITDSSIPCVSTDFGQTWNMRPPLPAIIHAIRTTNSGHGYAVGNAYQVFRTTDSWNTFVDIGQELYETSNHFTGSVIDKNKFIVGGYWGALFATKDGGVTWNDELSTKSFSWFEFFSVSEGVAVYKDIVTGEYVYGETVDGGRTWKDVINLISTKIGGRIRHLTRNTLFSYPAAGFERGKHILKSTDRGRTWMESFTTTEEDTIKLVGTLFMSEWNRQGDETAFAPTNKGLLVSTDHGQSWILKEAIKKMTDAEIMYMDMNQPGSWIMTRDGSLYKSSDDGDTWTRIFVLPDSIIQPIPAGLNVVTDDLVLVSILARGGYYICITTDGGLNWAIDLINQNQHVIAFPSGVSYGFGGPGTRAYREQRFLLRSDDYWRTQTISIDLRGGSFTLPFFLDEKIGWFATPFHLLHTTNGGTSWTELPLPGTKSVSLQPSYPNPVAGSGTTIPFTVTGNKDVHVRIDVHDLLGRKVATVHDKPVPPGSHSALWVTHGVTPGMYFVRIVGAEIEVRKVVVR